MRKRDELNNPNSCMSKAADNEMTFVLLGRDIAAPAAIRAWCAERVRMGKNTIEDPQIGEALDCARAMESTCHICGRETGGVVCCTATPAPPPPDLRAETLAVLREIRDTAEQYGPWSFDARLARLIERLEAASEGEYGDDEEPPMESPTDGQAPPAPEAGVSHRERLGWVLDNELTRREIPYEMDVEQLQAVAEVVAKADREFRTPGADWCQQQMQNPEMTAYLSACAEACAGLTTEELEAMETGALTVLFKSAPPAPESGEWFREDGAARWPNSPAPEAGEAQHCEGCRGSVPNDKPTSSPYECSGIAAEKAPRERDEAREELERANSEWKEAAHGAESARADLARVTRERDEAYAAYKIEHGGRAVDLMQLKQATDALAVELEAFEERHLDCEHDYTEDENG